MTVLHAGAVMIALLSGSCSLAALVAGSPHQFGAALASCGAGWIVADFIEWTDECKRERAVRRYAIRAAQPSPDYRSCYVVYVGGGEYFSRPARGFETGLAA